MGGVHTSTSSKSTSKRVEEPINRPALRAMPQEEDQRRISLPSKKILLATLKNREEIREEAEAEEGSKMAIRRRGKRRRKTHGREMAERTKNNE